MSVWPPQGTDVSIRPPRVPTLAKGPHLSGYSKGEHLVLGKNFAHDMKSGAEGAHFSGALLLTFSFDKHSTIALLSGDGAGIYKNEGFFADLKKLHNVGWNIEVYAWDETCHRGMKEFAEQNWNFTNLTDSYYHITFLQGVRAAI